MASTVDTIAKIAVLKFQLDRLNTEVQKESVDQTVVDQLVRDANVTFLEVRQISTEYAVTVPEEYQGR